MPAIVAWSVIASRNSDPPIENLTNTALRVTGGSEQVAEDWQSADQSLPTFVIPEVKIQKKIFCAC